MSHWIHRPGLAPSLCDCPWKPEVPDRSTWRDIWKAAGWEGGLAGPLLGVCSSTGLTSTQPVDMTRGMKTGSQVRTDSAQV